MLNYITILAFLQFWHSLGKINDNFDKRKTLAKIINKIFIKHKLKQKQKFFEIITSLDNFIFSIFLNKIK